MSKESENITEEDFDLDTEIAILLIRARSAGYTAESAVGVFMMALNRFMYGVDKEFRDGLDARISEKEKGQRQ